MSLGYQCAQLRCWPGPKVPRQKGERRTIKRSGFGEPICPFCGAYVDQFYENWRGAPCSRCNAWLEFIHSKVPEEA